MELEDQWWKGQLAADIYQALRYKVRDSVMAARGQLRDIKEDCIYIYIYM